MDESFINSQRNKMEQVIDLYICIDENYADTRQKMTKL